MADAARRCAGIVADPDYRVEIQPSSKRVRVRFGGVAVADSRRALVLREPRQPPAYYLPPEDVRLDLLQPSRHSTYCPFKGSASYWTVRLGERRSDNAAWSYREPAADLAAIAGYIAFSCGFVEAVCGDRPEVEIELDGGDADNNPLVGWLLREAWEAATSEELVGRLARQLVESGIPLVRLSMVLRTLHPQLLGTAFTWRRDRPGLDQTQLPHIRASSREYLQSPLVPIFAGAGAIRRRLEGPSPQLDFPIIEDLLAEGASDYLAMPLPFSDGQINAITFATDRPGGFSARDLAWIGEILPMVSRLFEVQAMRLTAKALLDTYLGRYSGERVLNGLIKRGDGADVPAVIWLCDLRGSTAMADSLPRERYLAVLNDFFECTAGAVLDHGGEVLKFMGDAVLAIFPVDGTDFAPGGSPAEACTSALAAAREASARVADLNRTRVRRGEPPLRFALALHLGEVTYGNIGVAGRLDFTVIGRTTNEVSRLAGLCKVLGRSILVSDSFARRLPAGLISLGHHVLRGVSARQEIFTLADQGFADPAAIDVPEGGRLAEP